jgi:hypothetical protein
VTASLYKQWLSRKGEKDCVCEVRQRGHETRHHLLCQADPLLRFTAPVPSLRTASPSGREASDVCSVRYQFAVKLLSCSCPLTSLFPLCFDGFRFNSGDRFKSSHNPTPTITIPSIRGASKAHTATPQSTIFVFSHSPSPLMHTQPSISLHTFLSLHVTLSSLSPVSLLAPLPSHGDQ